MGEKCCPLCLTSLKTRRTFSFRIDHASFQEYIASRYIVNRIRESEVVDASRKKS